MDKQELYVAASRSREETFIYATPEIQTHREEIAPELPHLREGIPHIAEAAERDRSQLAAHDEALRSQFSGLPTEELVARRADLLAARSRGQGGGAEQPLRSGSRRPANDSTASRPSAKRRRCYRVASAARS